VEADLAIARIQFTEKLGASGEDSKYGLSFQEYLKYILEETIPGDVKLSIQELSTMRWVRTHTYAFKKIRMVFSPLLSNICF
jgi:hypothetical protein